MFSFMSFLDTLNIYSVHALCLVKGKNAYKDQKEK